MKLNAIGGLLPLDAPERVVVFRSAGKIRRHIFRRVTSMDWENFFINVRMELVDAGRGDAQIVGTDTASLRLYSDAILRAEGYEMPDGRRPEEQSDWPRCVPRDHRLKVVYLLANAVNSGKEKAVVADAKGLSVRIDAFWNEGEPGAMKKYFGLVHRFRSPTALHRQRLLDAGKADFMMTVAGRGKAVLPSSHAVLVALYDELIEAAPDYSIEGLPLGSREQIVSEMDSVHKAACINAIFPASLGQVN